MRRTKHTGSAFSLIVFIFIFQLPPDRSKQQKPPQRKQDTTNVLPSPVTEPSPTAITNIENCPCKQKNGAEAEAKPSPEKSFWGDAPTWGLVVIGFIAALIALCTLNDIKKQTRHLGNFVKATNNIVQTTLNADRAWVDVTLGTPTTTVDQYGYTIGYHPDAGDYGRYGIYITNYGRTVGRIIDFKVRSATSANIADIELEKFEARFGNDMQMLLSANKPGVVIENFDFPSLFKSWDNIQDRAVIGAVRVDVRYEDIIRGEIAGKPRESHRTTVVFGWDPSSEELVLLPRHSQYS